MWRTYLVFGAVLVAAYYLVPEHSAGAVPRVALYVTVSASAAVAVFVGVARNRPRPRLPWALIGAGQAVYAVADANFYINHYLRNDLTYPAIADAFYLLHYPLVTAGLIVLIRRRSPHRDLPGLLDVASLAVVAAMLSWVFLIAPQTEASEPLLVTATSLAYPVLDLAMLAVAVRLILGGGSRPAAFFLLVGNLAVIMTADSIYVLQQLSGSYSGAGNYLDAVWLLGNVLVGAAALHPTMSVLSEQPEDPPGSLGLGRIAVLCIAALVAPATLWIQDRRGELDHVAAIALACALLFVLTIARLAVLVVEQRRLAITDALTGLRSRRFLDAQLPLEVARAERSGGAVALLLVDVDHFKSINDSFGHPAGDRALIEVASRLRVGSRTGDVLARYGGEEFALLMPVFGTDRLAAVAERLRREVARTPIAVLAGVRVELTVSIGAAGYPEHGHSPTELIEVADRALYAAKESGRDRAVVGPARRRERPDPYANGPVAHLVRLAEHVDELQSMYGRSRAVGRWSAQVCTRLGCPPQVVRRAEVAGLLHGVGRIMLPISVLTAAGAPTERDRWLLRTHPEHGYRLVRSFVGLADAAEVIRQQHAPPTADVALEAKVITVCATWVAVQAAVPSDGSPPELVAAAELHAGRGTRFDAGVVGAFLDLHHRGVLEPWPTAARHTFGSAVWSRQLGEAAGLTARPGPEP